MRRICRSFSRFLNLFCCACFHLFLTTNTGQDAWRTTSSVVLPKKTCCHPVRPCVEIAIRSEPSSLHASVISVAGGLWFPARARLKTLHLHLLRQTTATLVVTVGVFTFVLLLGNVLKDVFDLLATGKASVGLVLRAILLLVPFAMTFALPIAMLTATLLVFGRLSTDGEITAIRAGGISLVAAIAPVLALSILFSGVCAAFNCHVSPASRVAFKELQNEVIRARGFGGVAEGRYLDFGTLTLYAKEVRGTNLRDVIVYQVANGHRQLDLWAPNGEFTTDSNGLPKMLLLRDVQGVAMDNGFFASEWPTNLTALHPESVALPR